jgi:hypothetical protein
LRNVASDGECLPEIIALSSRATAGALVPIRCHLGLRHPRVCTDGLMTYAVVFYFVYALMKDLINI